MPAATCLRGGDRQGDHGLRVAPPRARCSRSWCPRAGRPRSATRSPSSASRRGHLGLLQEVAAGAAAEAAPAEGAAPAAAAQPSERQGAEQPPAASRPARRGRRGGPAAAAVLPPRPRGHGSRPAAGERLPGGVRASPLARKLAGERGVDLRALRAPAPAAASCSGTSRAGRACGGRAPCRGPERARRRPPAPRPRRRPAGARTGACRLGQAQGHRPAAGRVQVQRPPLLPAASPWRWTASWPPARG